MALFKILAQYGEKLEVLPKRWCIQTAAPNREERNDCRPAREDRAGKKVARDGLVDNAVFAENPQTFVNVSDELQRRELVIQDPLLSALSEMWLTHEPRQVILNEAARGLELGRFNHLLDTAYRTDLIAAPQWRNWTIAAIAVAAITTNVPTAAIVLKSSSDISTWTERATNGESWRNFVNLANPFFVD